MASSKVPLGRLTGEAIPLAYRLDLTIDPARERFSGKVEIDVRLQDATSRIYLHGRDLAMHRVSAIAGDVIQSGAWKQVDPTGVALLTFPEPLAAGPITLAFEYDAAFSQDPAGLFRVKVGEDWYGWSQFQSIDARAAFPSFDEPGFKTPFTLTMRTKPGQLAIGNAPLVSKQLEEDLEVHRFAPTLPLPTYLVAIMAGPFVTLDSAVPPTPQRSHPLPIRLISTRQNRERLGFALQGSKDMVVKLEDYFGQAFPYPKLDQITSPIMPGAMENAGANLYGDEFLLVGEQSTVARKRDYGMIVAHELSHQWFGDLVTPAWWDDIWLNESFANWMGYNIGHAWRPDLSIAGGALSEGFEAMETDALAAGRPIRQPIASNVEIDSAFDSITYGKGGHVVAMIAAFMGETRFRNGVRRYMAAHAHGNATSIDFFDALAAEAGDPRILPALRSFTDQQGVPLLTFSRTGKGYALRQSRYAPLGVDPPKTTWGIPICLRLGEQRRCELMNSETLDVTIEGKGALMPNTGGAGYYRFELPKAEWDRLIRAADRLPGGEAQALADSLFASFIAGKASAKQLTDAARKLVRNPDSHANAAASTILSKLAASEAIDELALPTYRNFNAKLYRPILDELGFDPRAGAYSGEPPERSQRRALAVARLVSAGTERDLRNVLIGAAAKYVSGDIQALDPGWFDRAFDLWLAGKDLPAVRTLAEKALASQDEAFRAAAMDAIATTGNEQVATWLLDEFADPRLRPSEQRRLLQGVLLTGRTREMGYRWLRANYDRLSTGREGIFLAARLPQMLSGFCSVSRAREFAEELRPRFAGKPGALELERVIESVRNCGVFRDARLLQVSQDVLRLR